MEPAYHVLGKSPRLGKLLLYAFSSFHSSFTSGSWISYYIFKLGFIQTGLNVHDAGGICWCFCGVNQGLEGGHL